MATVLHAALAESKTPLSSAAAAPASPPQIDFDTAAVDQALGAKGTNNGGVYQFGIPRAEPIKDNGMDVPPPMGSANAINFQPTGGGKAAITGDFVLIATEVNPVLKALRDHGIEVTAIHNHMLDDQPHLYFLHFWANDDAKKLAEGLKAALAHVNIAKSSRRHFCAADRCDSDIYPSELEPRRKTVPLVLKGEAPTKTHTSIFVCLRPPGL
jgi:hypothetical protein